MTSNPYEAPGDDSLDQNDLSKRRHQGLMWFRGLLVVLLLPAIYNYIRFDHAILHGPGVSAGLIKTYRAVNMVLIAIGSLSLWIWGYPVIEWLSMKLKRLFGPNKDPLAWQDCLHRSARQAFRLSFPAAALWFVWVHIFYRSPENFILLSWLIGIPAHLLAACWYIPLFRSWAECPRQTDH
ncbi:hypothetical protein [Rhodopirellula sp. MGV]|uniref:hypothetical protein n=1 Tax=Rhodopirellula sp. MGV TaxID=2023130 RepID=UPI000B95E91C|nr:hypothetical protein [Rhodopirellula sp. MGV]OYP38922.1 hypothetical protein CGZ80_01500 [Rhodopirellula sp. MGV]PNY37600.1 hypothetical protein C2E31_06465 [Rhodopirellula baltica]